MIAADHPLASQAGLEIHKQGGNIVDVAIAVSFTISVVKPHSTGIGGGGFLLYHNAIKKKTESFDFRERAPLGATRDMYLDGAAATDDSVVGIRSVGVPGLVKGLVQIHKKYGKLPLATVMAPAIRAAKKGFPLYPELQQAIMGRFEYIQKDPGMAHVFLRQGTVPENEELIVQKDLAKTLETIADKGEAVFYKGWIADKIVALMESEKGLLTAKDLKQYRMKERKPVEGSYRDLKIVSMGPPSSGGIHIIEMLNMLEPYDLQAMKHDGTAYNHLLAEVMRRAYKDRSIYLGDPDFVDVPGPKLMAKSYAKKVMGDFSPQQATLDLNTQAPLAEPVSTTNFSIMDQQGNAIASTQTINYFFGSVVMVPGTGIILNDEMDDFSVAPGFPNKYGLVGGEANSIAPQKTPLSSMSPTFVFKDNRVDLVAGAPGGSHIITGVLQTILNIYDFKMSLGDALAAPRIHHQYLPNEIFVEEEQIPPQTITSLEKMGHQINLQPESWSRLSAVKYNNGKLTGATDPRGVGEPAGL